MQLVSVAMVAMDATKNYRKAPIVYTGAFHFNKV
jgi:hypothetical protein